MASQAGVYPQTASCRMSMRRLVLAAVSLLPCATASLADSPNLGRPASPEDIAAWDISIAPDGIGLPRGSGTPEQGEVVYRTACLTCHGERGTGKPNDALVGGKGTLAGDAVPVKTVGSFWPYATTLFDYVHRAMPYQAPGSLSVDDTYAVVAYILSLNGITSADGKLDKASLPLVKMPNRDGFIPEAEFGPSRQPGKK
jgi:S-disulfanyl-L-cysteine oxidoreductase SoxD